MCASFDWTRGLRGRVTTDNTDRDRQTHDRIEIAIGFFFFFFLARDAEKGVTGRGGGEKWTDEKGDATCTHSMALLTILSPNARAGAAMHAYMMYLAVLGSTLALDRLIVAPFLSLCCVCGGKGSASEV